MKRKAARIVPGWFRRRTGQAAGRGPEAAANCPCPRITRAIRFGRTGRTAFARPAWRPGARGIKLLRLRIVLSFALAVFTAASVTAQESRDYVSLVGPPQVLPLAVAVASALSGESRQKFAAIEYSTVEAGKRSFCSGTSDDSPDILLLPRPEGKPFDGFCNNPSVGKILEVPVGRQVLGLAIARAERPFPLTIQALYLAMARLVPRADGDGGTDRSAYVPNWSRTWRDIDPDLPDIPIRVLAPPRTSRDWWTISELILEPGCAQAATKKRIAIADRVEFQRLCNNLRDDGRLVFGDSNGYAAGAAAAPAGPDVLLTYQGLIERMTTVVSIPVDGSLPTPEAIENGSYPLANMVAVIVKVAKINLVPGLRPFLKEITSNKAAGAFGYMMNSSDALQPLSDADLIKSAAIIRDLQ